VALIHNNNKSRQSEAEAPGEQLLLRVLARGPAQAAQVPTLLRAASL
jgi:hypothetical protein